MGTTANKVQSGQAMVTADLTITRKDGSVETHKIVGIIQPSVDKEHEHGSDSSDSGSHRDR